ncbi:MAG TPA: hypothetical protein VF131_04680 [Blastocatellia bacterium]|nr:hypothetical protein [Blastocatellia bacterium]
MANKNTRIHIGQVSLRIPGNGAEPANRVANGIARSLAQKVPTDMHRGIGALNLRVQAPAGATEADLSDAVAGAIVKALRKGERPG